MNDHAAIVLAAGESRRLGRPKQLLTRDGETLVRRAVRLAAATMPGRLLLVTGAHAAEVAAACADLPAQQVHNPEWRQGMGGSLRAAAAALAGVPTAPRHCLLLACDQPALDIDHLRALLDAARRSRSRCALTDYGKARGIPAVVTLVRLSEAPDGDQGLRAVLAALPREDIAWLPRAELGLDVDTEADLRDAVARGWLDPPGAR